MKFPNLTEEEIKKCENGIVQVNGKAMNRTALGIIDAYLKLFPDSTYNELKAAFPDSLNPSGPRAPKTIFKPFTERDFGVVHSLDEITEEFKKAELPYDGLFFLEANEIFITSDNVSVIVNRLWESKDTHSGESDLENLAKQAAKFGIVVNKFEPRTPFGKGSYSLDILQQDLFDKIIGKTKVVEREVIHEKTVEKKVIPFWVWILLLLALIPLILWLKNLFFDKPNIKEVTKIKEIIKTDTILKLKVDTVFVKEVEVLQTKFNSVQFQVGKWDIAEEAKYALNDLANLMKKQPNLNLKIEGHTSDEGDVKFNQELSVKRAKGVVDFIVSRGVDVKRLTFEGKGSSEPIDINNREANRRTEFIILD